MQTVGSIQREKNDHPDIFEIRHVIERRCVAFAVGSPFGQDRAQNRCEIVGFRRGHAERN